MSEPLTPMQERVVAVIATGASDPEVARALHMTANTARTHVKAVMQRLDIHTRSGLTAWYLNRRHAEVLRAARAVCDAPDHLDVEELTRRVHSLQDALGEPYRG